MTSPTDSNNNTLNTHIFTNRGGNTLIKEFKGILTHDHSIQNLDAVVGFLRASGYFTLRPFLNDLRKVRILIGIDVDKYIAQSVNEGKLFYDAASEVKDDYLDLVRQDIEQANYTKEVEDGMFQLVKDIKDGKVELRAHPSKKIHAKIYVLYPDEFSQYTFGKAITGSSNLSGNGLGTSVDRQYEFNVKLESYEDVKFAKDEFETLWEESRNCEITDSDIKSSIDKTYLKGDVTPYELYIKMLIEYFADRVAASDDNFDMPDGYAKYDYQLDAVNEGYQKLLRYDGFFLADVVGLGKTVIATMIAKKFLIENGRENTKILVVYPPAVEQNWKTTFKDFGIDKYTNFISNGSLEKVLDVDNFNYWNAEEFDLILVDEAHKFRNNDTGAFKRLQEICKMPRLDDGGGIPGSRKKVMLISATPMNNSPEDLYHEILLFQDARRCTIDGVSNLTRFFAPLIKEFKLLKRNTASEARDFKELAERVRERIIKPITVRRTRTDIESVERYNKDVNGFPKVERPLEGRYELNERLANLFDRTMHTLVDDIKYMRYQAIAFLKPEAANGRYENAERTSRSLAAISKTSMVKRLESSFYAFKASLNSFKKANQNMIDMFERDKVFIAPDLNINALIEAGFSDDEIEEKLNAKAEDNPQNVTFNADDFKPDFIENLRADNSTLERLCAEWEKVTDQDDSKFAKFNDLLKHELFKSDRNPEGKLVVFSESVKTVEYLKQRINRDDVLVVTAENRGNLFKTIRENFDANYKTKLNEYNIILTTDVLAEGVNLHRSNIIVNYDTPWNSTRLMQRIGRVNRIGSVSKHIYNYVFYPSREGNRELHLYQIALSKIQMFHSTLGEDNAIYSQSEIIDHDMGKLFDETMESEKQDRDLELPYYEELHALYKNDRNKYNRIKNLSIRSRTGRNPRTVDGVTLSGDSLVFLKTNFRKLFYLVSDEAKEISAIDAIKYFKAEKDEKPVARIEQHFDHVKKAEDKFKAIKDSETANADATQNDRSSMGASMNAAVNLLNGIINSNLITSPELQANVNNLKALALRGTITEIPTCLSRINKALAARQITRNEALPQIIELANKYARHSASQETTLNNETAPSIILSESFC